MEKPANLMHGRQNLSAITPKKKILVTGGAGYIGSALLPLLLAEGYQVRILDLLIYGLDPIKSWSAHPRLEIMQGDFRNRDVVSRAMQDVDSVIHLGAIVADSACDLNEQLAREVNLQATQLIAETARRCQVGHFIFASTCSVYGSSCQFLDEHSGLNPVTLYARTKAAAENFLLNLADDRFSPVVLRFSTVYGLSGRYRFDLVINLLTAKALFDGVITVYGGSQWRSFVHVEDAARSILSALDAPAGLIRGEVFNVGSSDQNYSISQIGDLVHSYIPSARVIVQDDLVDPQNYQVNCSKIHTRLGFSPRWTVEQGIQQVIAAIQAGEVKDYKEARYSNIKFLSTTGLDLLEHQATIPT